MSCVVLRPRTYKMQSLGAESTSLALGEGLAERPREPLPDPPSVLQAVLRAQDRGIALEAVAGQFFYYDRDALIEQGQLVPCQRS